MSTRTWTQPVYDKSGRLIGHFHHTDVSTPALRTQQARPTTTSPQPVQGQPSQTAARLAAYASPGHAALACPQCHRITNCACGVSDGNLTTKIDEAIRIHRQRQQGLNLAKPKNAAR